ncbi:MAG TPA: hypothetical protein VG034_18150 [Acidimicrobiia bacterium]|nr:hypothetical protein [Acidimicrobiia bacterium]
MIADVDVVVGAVAGALQADVDRDEKAITPAQDGEAWLTARGEGTILLAMVLWQLRSIIGP